MQIRMSDESQSSPAKGAGSWKQRGWSQRAAASLKTAKRLWRHTEPKAGRETMSEESQMPDERWKIRKKSFPSHMQTTIVLPRENDLSVQEESTTGGIIMKELNSDTVELSHRNSIQLLDGGQPSMEQQSRTNVKIPDLYDFISIFPPAESEERPGVRILNEDIPTIMDRDVAPTQLGLSGPEFPADVELFENGESLDITQTEAWREVCKLRVETWSIRSKVEEDNKALRKLEQVKISTEENLLELQFKLGASFESGESKTSPEVLHTLSELRKKYSVTQNLFQLREREYHQLVDELSKSEKSLTTHEERFYLRPTKPRNRPQIREISPGRSLDEDSADLDSSSVAGSEQFSYHPLVTKYLSKLGDLELLQERIGEYIDDQITLEQEEQNQHNKGLALDSHDQNLLDNLGIKVRRTQEHKKMLEEQIKELLQQCKDEGLMDEDGEPIEVQPVPENEEET